jgi:hypothetical protein
MRSSLHLAPAFPCPALLAIGCGRDLAQPETGEVLYRRYRAARHGLTGRGDGPAAKTLSPPPADLTRLRADLPTLMQQIDGRRAVAAHGTASMPVWGEIFEQSLMTEPHTQRTALLQLQTLAEHVHGLQGRTP